MAKLSSIQKNLNRQQKVKKFAAKRARLIAIARDRSLNPPERFEAQLKLSEMPRNSAKTRLVNRCEITGRARAYHRLFKLSRIALREMASKGLIPGVIKSSW